MSSLKFIIGLLIFISITHFLALYNFWYWTYQWLDIPMHFLGGFWTGVVFFWLAKKYFPQIFQSLNISIILIFALSFVALVGIFLEFAEFFYDILISSRDYGSFLQLGAADTLADLFFDLLGGLVLIFLVFPKKSVY